MKILLIHNYYQQRGGEDNYFDSLARLLKRKGHSVYLFTKKSSEIKSFGHKMQTAIELHSNTQVLREISSIIDQFKPDIAHSQNILPSITKTAHYACKAKNVPVVHTIQSYRYLCPKGTLFLKEKTCEVCVMKKFSYPAIVHGCYHNSRLASLALVSASFLSPALQQLALLGKIHFPSRFIQNYYIEHLNIAPKKTFVVPNFVPPTINTHKPQMGNYFIFVGRLAEEKGIRDLIHAFSLLKDQQLIIIGDGPLKQYVISNKTQNVIYKGFMERSEILSHMASARATIVPSPWYEVCPTVIMESFSSHTPVIAPSYGVFPELVTNNKTGYLYKHRDIQDLVRVVRFVSKQEENKNVRKNCQIEYLRKYTDDAHYKKLIKAYQSLLNQSTQLVDF